MGLINKLQQPKEIEFQSLNKIKPLKASRKILAIHRHCLDHLKKQKTKPQLMSPFSLFNQQAKVMNPLKISLAKPSPLHDKISTISQPGKIENPLQDFIQSLSTVTKPKEVKMEGSLQFSTEIIEVVNQNKEFTTLRMKRPTDWEFLPGQYLEIRPSNSTSSRAAILAIASSINDEFIEITAKPNPNPSHANYCLNSKVGETLTITGPLGTNFPVNLITDDTSVLVLGGGSGLTALKSVMESLPFGTDSKLIYSSKTRDELLYLDEIEKWKAVGHTISFTQDKVDGFYQGRITEHLRQVEIKSNLLVFICGPEELVLETTQLLASMGIPRESIYGSLPATAEEGGPVYRGDHPEMLTTSMG
ncbi:MAG: hypothetical protein ACH350_01745 [Parachlamydiaceae bacterium]